MIKENLIKALVSILILFIALGLLGLWYEKELIQATNWVVDRIGFAGICLILLVTDTLVTPVSPDILLVVIAKSDLAEDWFLYVFFLGLVSVIAGMLGWSIGHWLGHFRFVKNLFDQLDPKQRDFIRKYGFWAIALGAATPLPYSATCWTAGVLGIRWSVVLAASLAFRTPRMLVYYLLIASTGKMFG